MEIRGKKALLLKKEGLEIGGDGGMDPEEMKEGTFARREAIMLDCTSQK